MPLIKGAAPSLIGGVSQQDSSVRLPSQIEAALNCDLSPALGACKRPPTTFVNQLGWDIPDNAFFHSIERDSQERYLVVIYGDRVRVFNHITGKEHVVVTNEASRAYLRASFDPYISMRAATIEDMTFLVNREVYVRMSSEVVPGGVSASVQTFQDLPKTAPYTAVYEIRGATNDAFTRSYVRRESEGVWAEVAKPGIQSALDLETMPHGLKRIPDSITPDGFYFSFGPLQYDKRFAGDDKSCPPPSFVGQRIGNAVYHHDRLALLAGENVILSEVGHYLNFWRTTVSSLLASDPIDVAGPSEGVAQFTHGLSYQDALLLYASGKKSMFQLTADPVLTPTTAKIQPVTNYQCSPVISPVVAGSSVFFLNDTQGKPWSTLREYFVQSDVITPDAADVSAHVPHYIPGNTRCMASAQDANLVLLAHRNPSGPQVFVHQFKWSGDTKQQSAWHPWQFATMGAVLHMHAIGTDLYVAAVAPGGGVELMKLDLSTCPVAQAVSNTEDVLLDRREVVTPVYQAFGNYTDIKVPYVMPTLDGLLVLQTVDRANPGAFMDIRNGTLVDGGQTLRVPGNLGAGRVMVGYRYMQSIEMSQQYLRDQNDRAQLAGRLQLRRMTVRFQDTGYFRVRVLTKGRAGAVDTLVPGLQSTYSSRTAGDAAFLLGTPTAVDGTHSFLVPSRADRARVIFENDSPFQARFQSVQWEALYTTQVRM